MWGNKMSYEWVCRIEHKGTTKDLAICLIGGFISGFLSAVLIFGVVK